MSDFLEVQVKVMTSDSIPPPKKKSDGGFELWELGYVSEEHMEELDPTIENDEDENLEEARLELSILAGEEPTKT